MSTPPPLCTALSGYECSFCDQNLSPWMSKEEAEKPEAAGGAPDQAGVYVYGVNKSSARTDVVFIGRSNSSVRAKLLDEMGDLDSKLQEYLAKHGDAVRIRFAVNDDDSGCSESDLICEHWKTAKKLPKFSRKWPDRQGSIDQD